MNLPSLIAHGFDQSTLTQPAQYSVKCSACAALVINGTPTHERNCPNARHECRGCYELIPMNQRYCSDCSN